MQTILQKAAERGHANHNWLDTWHSFSFSQYQDANRMHFGALRVLNDDYVKAGYGFSKHPHENMEIVTIPLFGDLEHKDSTGRHAIIRQHDVQIMSAGSGIQHSEKNPNHDQDVNFLQIWVFPQKRNIEPLYAQKTFRPEDRRNRIQTVVAPDDEQALWINQEAWFSLLAADAGFSQPYAVKKESNGVYAFVINGSITLNGIPLEKRDGLGIWDTGVLDIQAGTDAELLLIDVPMQVPGLR